MRTHTTHAQEDCTARIARLSRDVGEATAEAGQCKVRVTRVAADVEGCLQVCVCVYDLAVTQHTGQAKRCVASNDH